MSSQFVQCLNVTSKPLNQCTVQFADDIFHYQDPLDGAKLDDLLSWGISRKVAEFSIQTGTVVMAEVEGKICPITNIPATVNEVESIVRYIYGENGPAEIRGGSDIDISHEIKISHNEFRRFRVNITGGRFAGSIGMQISIRVLPEQPIAIDELNIEDEIVRNLRPKQGMILITGPTGSGKSTLMASAIRNIIEQPHANEKVIEYSAPIEYVYDNVEKPSSLVFQTHAGVHLRPRGKTAENSTFSYCVRNALRRKPTIIIIGEARDKETIVASVEAALTGHLLYSTMHTKGVGATLRRAVLPFPESTREAIATDIIESIQMIVTQLLVPMVGGGRVACREFMVFNDEIRDSFLNQPINSWPQHSRELLSDSKVCGQSLTDSASKLLAQGEIAPAVYHQLST